MDLSKMLVEFIFALIVLKSFWVIGTLMKLQRFVNSYCSYRAKFIKPIVLDSSIDQNDVKTIEAMLLPKLRKLREDLQLATPKYMLNQTLKIPSVLLTFLVGLVCTNGSDFINMDMISKMSKELQNANSKFNIGGIKE